MSKKLLIVSSDCHANQNPDGYRPFVEKAYLDDFDTWARGQQGDEGKVNRVLQTRFRSGPREILEEEYDVREEFQTSIDVDYRLKTLESDGIAAEIVFPNQVPLGGGLGNLAPTKGRAAELAAAGQKAYNRWLGNFVDPSRMAGVALIGGQWDRAEAAKEVYWAKENGLKAIMPDGIVWGETPLFDPSYDQFWAACADTGLPISFHGSGGGLPPYDYSSATGLFLVASESTIFGHRSLWYMMWGGVFERHPNLKVAFTEMYSDWLARTLKYMDFLYESSPLGGLEGIVERKPSEYWERQCAIGCSVFSRAEAKMRHEIGVGGMMYGSDSAHAEGSWARTLTHLRATLGEAGATEEELRAICGLNAAKFYDFDLDVLEPVAERCGPTIEDVMTPLSEAERNDPMINHMWLDRPPSL